jgi:hypothetical protein
VPAPISFFKNLKKKKIVRASSLFLYLWVFVNMLLYTSFVRCICVENFLLICFITFSYINIRENSENRVHTFHNNNKTKMKHLTGLDSCCQFFFSPGVSWWIMRILDNFFQIFYSMFTKPICWLFRLVF